jgi:hypothetical protein
VIARHSPELAMAAACSYIERLESMLCAGAFESGRIDWALGSAIESLRWAGEWEDEEVALALEGYRHAHRPRWASEAPR